MICEKSSATDCSTAKFDTRGLLWLSLLTRCGRTKKSLCYTPTSLFFRHWRRKLSFLFDNIGHVCNGEWFLLICSAGIMETFGRTSKLSKLPTVVSNNKTIGGKLLLARMMNYNIASTCCWQSLFPCFFYKTRKRIKAIDSIKKCLLIWTFIPKSILIN